jgi:hypothetical protein
MKVLSKRQKKYVESRINGATPTDAARIAGYTANASCSSIRLEKNENVQLALATQKARQLVVSVKTVDVLPPDHDPVSTTSGTPKSHQNAGKCPSLSKSTAIVPAVSSQVCVIPRFPLIEPVDRDELLSILSNILRDQQEVLSHRLLAAKIISDLRGFLDPTKRQGDVFVTLGEVEKNL